MLIQAVLIPSYLPLLAEKQATIVICLLCYVVGCVHKMAKPDMSLEWNQKLLALKSLFSSRF
jgi:hypothetical protein